MEWNTAKNDDVRIVEKFLLFPKNLHGITKWLIHAKIQQQYLFGWVDENWAE